MLQKSPIEVHGNFFGADVPSTDIVTNCMHCGLCLPTCPTYALTGAEKSSPRGRIRLIKAVADGDLEISDGFIEEMSFCLDCQACQTACPAGVTYGALVEAARAQILQQGKTPFVERTLKRIFLQQILPSKAKIKIAARFLRLYQQSGFTRFLEKTGIAEMFSEKMRELPNLSPHIDNRFSDEQIPVVSKPYGETQHRVAFLTGCIMNVAFAEVNNDTIEVLRQNGCEVITPRAQECCGSLQAHNGDFATARKLAKHNVDIFLRDDVEAIIMNSAGCGAFMKEYGDYLKEDSHYATKAEALSKKVKDVSEFLVDINFRPPKRSMPKKVAYHDACHLVHSQKISAQPRQILRSLPGVELIDLPESTWCCGSAGIYNVVRYDDSMNLLERKMRNVRNTAADIVIASNPGCLLQMQYGAHRFGVGIEVLHLATLLRRAYDG